MRAWKRMGPKYSTTKTVRHASWGPGGTCQSGLGWDYRQRAGDVPRSLTISSPVERTPCSSRTSARRFLRIFLVEGSYRPMRLKSRMPDPRATATLASSTVASAGSSMLAGSFLMGCRGALLVSLREILEAIVPCSLLQSQLVPNCVH